VLLRIQEEEGAGEEATGVTKGRGKAAAKKKKGKGAKKAEEEEEEKVEEEESEATAAAASRIDFAQKKPGHRKKVVTTSTAAAAGPPHGSPGATVAAGESAALGSTEQKIDEADVGFMVADDTGTGEETAAGEEEGGEAEAAEVSADIGQSSTHTCAPLFVLQFVTIGYKL
jgi:hypothetical protein